jgi:hypothetical protein
MTGVSDLIGVTGGVTTKLNANIVEQCTNEKRNYVLHLEAAAGIVVAKITSPKFVCRKEDIPAKSHFTQ